MTPFARAALSLLLSLSLSLSLGIGCGADPGGSPPFDAGLGDLLPANCDPPKLTYVTFGMAFLNDYCNGCHGFTQQSAQLEPTTFIDVAVTNTYMPPSAPMPSATQRMQLGEWLDCGAP